MSEPRLLVDPLAALLRPALADNAPLRLDRIHVDVSIVPPMANIVVERQFTNTTGELVEAVMTLPPLAPHEIVYRMFVTIGRRYHVEAISEFFRRARRAHDSAIQDGSVAILYELLDNDVQLISIAGIEPGETVQVQIWSTRPLTRPQNDRAAISISLAADRNLAWHQLLEADSPVISAERHTATLVVHTSERLQVQSDPWEQVPEILLDNIPCSFDCDRPIDLLVFALDGGSLDHSEWRVDAPGGWEVTATQGAETFRHPLNPGGSVISDRADWIFGILKSDDGEIRITAPLPSEDIAPNARAFRAAAAANIAGSATPQDPADLRVTANILSRQTSMIFIGPTGELPQIMPSLRKVALPAMFESIDQRARPDPPPVAQIPVEPQPISPSTVENDDVAPPPPFKGDSITPGARPPRYRWLTWAPVALTALVIIAAFQSINLPPVPTLAAFVVLMILNAIRCLPREGSPAHRRLPLVAILLVPWIASLLVGPMAGYVANGRENIAADTLIPLHYGLLVASAVLPLVLMPMMRGARRFTLVLAILNFVLTFLATSAGIIALSPGS